jgi:hypothetical protein
MSGLPIIETTVPNYLVDAINDSWPPSKPRPSLTKARLGAVDIPEGAQGTPQIEKPCQNAQHTAAYDQINFA